MKFFFILLTLCLLSLPMVSHAELIVCGSTTRYRTSFYADPVPLSPLPADCSVIDPENTALMTSQRALLATVPPKHLKVVGGVLAEFTAQEKADLANEESLAAQARQVFINEAAQVGVCKFDTLAELGTVLTNRKNSRLTQLGAAEANVQTQIDGIAVGANQTATVNNIKAALTQMKTIQFNVNEGLLDEMYLGFFQLGNCDLAKSKVGAR